MRWVLLFAVVAPIQTDPAAANRPPVLTCAGDIRFLPPEQAALGLPVRMEAVVTYVDAGNIVFVQDATTGTHIHNVPLDRSWRRGDRLLIEGKTIPGLYFPGVNATRLRSLGPGVVPTPRRVGLDELASGIFHYQLVAVEGVGRSATAIGENTSILRLAVGSRMLEVRVDGLPVESVDLVDARLLVEGLAGGVINNHRQLVSPYLKVGSYGQVAVIDPPPEPSGLAVVSFDDLLRFTPEGASGRRVKIRGTVLRAIAGEPIFVRQGGRAIMVETRSAEALRPGDIVEVLGFPQMGSYRAFLADATARRIGSEAPPAPRRTTIPQLLRGMDDADLVQLEGQLVASYAGPDSVLLALRVGDVAFRVHCLGHPFPSWEVGSLLSVTGICRIAGSGGTSNRDYNFKPESFELWAASPAMIRLLSMPTWWTPRRLGGVLGVLAVATLAALAWIAVLRGRLRAQTAIIRGQLAREVVLEERHRIAREVHDTLEQELVGLALRLDAAVAVAVADPRALTLLEATRRLVMRIQTEVRDLVWDLREAADGRRALGQLLSELAVDLQPAAAARLRVAVRGTPWPLPGPVEHHLLRIAQEAVTNALKHAVAEVVEIDISYEPEQLTLRIGDDGRGFEIGRGSEPKAGHFGLVGMRERARKIAARLELASTPGRGTMVEVRVPRTSFEPGGTSDGPGFDHHRGRG